MLDLYILENCPYCKKVLAFLEEHKIKFNPINIKDKKNEETLIKLGGKRQVPFLVDNDRNIQMYESNDIIEYRNQNGKFQTIDDIKKVKGIGESVFEKIKDSITI